MVNIKKDFNIWTGAFMRGVAVVGITFFSMSFMEKGFSFEGFQSGLIAGGMYMFLEMIKYYKITVPAKKNYSFILFP